jgi:multidrug transporter EmrE-like cation transporter
MSWLLLVASIVLEVLGTVSMKLSEGFSSPCTRRSWRSSTL